MIKFSLQCSNGHRFDGWFSSGESCEQQLDRALVACTDCGDTAVAKALMAPRIVGSPKKATTRAPDEAPASVPEPASDESTSDASPMAVAGRMREALHEMRRFVEKNSEHVGDRFADEARKIHKGEAEERNIHGNTTPDEARKLEEEGVPFGTIPWPKHDA